MSLDTGANTDCVFLLDVACRHDREVKLSVTCCMHADMAEKLSFLLDVACRHGREVKLSVRRCLQTWQRS